MTRRASAPFVAQRTTTQVVRPIAYEALARIARVDEATVAFARPEPNRQTDLGYGIAPRSLAARSRTSTRFPHEGGAPTDSAKLVAVPRAEGALFARPIDFGVTRVPPAAGLSERRRCRANEAYAPARLPRSAETRLPVDGSAVVVARALPGDRDADLPTVDAARRSTTARVVRRALAAPRALLSRGDDASSVQTLAARERARVRDDEPEVDDVRALDRSATCLDVVVAETDERPRHPPRRLHDADLTRHAIDLARGPGRAWFVGDAAAVRVGELRERILSLELRGVVRARARGDREEEEGPAERKTRTLHDGGRVVPGSNPWVENPERFEQESRTSFTW
jgi:hypothetical protein